MPDVGTEETSRGLAASHVSTAEWQSFEMRMRRRRAQRCLLRAEVALEAGFVEDARAALDEARILHAPPEEIARIEGSIAAAAMPAETPVRRTRWRRVAVAAGFGIAALVLGLGTFQRQSPAPVSTAEAVASAPTDAAESPTDAVQNVPVRISDVLAVPTTGIVTDDATPPEREAEADVPPPVPADATPSAAEPADDGPVPTRAVTPPLVPVDSTPTLPISSTSATAVPSAPLPPAADAPSRDTNLTARLASSNVAPVPGLAPPPPPRDEPAEVREVLSSYEEAYSRLDPSLARAVWPAVDERALSRAFSSLASQQVTLGRCDVSVNGATARATCAGTATWTPKVGGGGARTEARRWTFDLRKAGDAWRIERAVAR